jgi:cation transport ATPase
VDRDDHSELSVSPAWYRDLRVGENDAKGLPSDLRDALELTTRDLAAEQAKIERKQRQAQAAADEQMRQIREAADQRNRESERIAKKQSDRTAQDDFAASAMTIVAVVFGLGVGIFYLFYSFFMSGQNVGAFILGLVLGAISAFVSFWVFWGLLWLIYAIYRLLRRFT